MSLGEVGQLEIGDRDWDVLLRRLKLFKTLNDITEELRVTSLVTHPCYELMCDLCAPDLPENKTIEELEIIVKQYVEPKRSDIEKRHEFRQRKQGESESVSKYLQSIQQLAKTCNFGYTLEFNLRDQFVLGLRHESMRSRLLAEPKLNYKRAVELALELESLMDAAPTLVHAEPHSAAAQCKSKAKRATNVGEAYPSRPDDADSDDVGDDNKDVSEDTVASFKYSAVETAGAQDTATQSSDTDAPTRTKRKTTLSTVTAAQERFKSQGKKFDEEDNSSTPFGDSDTDDTGRKIEKGIHTFNMDITQQQQVKEKERKDKRRRRDPDRMAVPGGGITLAAVARMTGTAGVATATAVETVGAQVMAARFTHATPATVDAYDTATHSSDTATRTKRKATLSKVTVAAQERPKSKRTKLDEEDNSSTPFGDSDTDDTGRKIEEEKLLFNMDITQQQQVKEKERKDKRRRRSDSDRMTVPGKRKAFVTSGRAAILKNITTASTGVKKDAATAAATTITKSTRTVAGTTSANRTTAISSITSANTTSTVAETSSTNYMTGAAATSTDSTCTSTNSTSVAPETTNADSINVENGTTSANRMSPAAVKTTTDGTSQTAGTDIANSTSVAAAATSAESTSSVAATSSVISTSMDAGFTTTNSASVFAESISVNSPSAIAAITSGNSTSTFAATSIVNSTSVAAAAISADSTSPGAATRSVNSTNVAAAAISAESTSTGAATSSVISTRMDAGTTTTNSASVFAESTSVNNPSAIAGSTSATSTSAEAETTSFNRTSAVAGSTSTNRTSAVVWSTISDRTSAVAGSTSTNTTSAVAGSTSTNRTSAVAGSTSTDRTSAVAGSTSTDRTSAVARSTSTNRMSAVAGSTSTGRTSAVAGSTSTDRTSAVAGSTSTNRTSVIAGSNSTNRTSAVAGSTSTDRTSAVAGSTSANRTSAVAGSNSTNRTSAVAGSTSTNRTSAVAGSTSTNRTSAVAGSNSTNRTSAVAGSTSTNRTSAVAGSTSDNRTSADAGSTSTNRTSAVAGSTSTNRTSAVAGSNSTNRTSAVAGSTSTNRTSAVAGSTSTNRTSAVAGSTSTNRTSAVAGSIVTNRTSAVAGSTSTNRTSAVAGSTGTNRTIAVAGSTSTNRTSAVAGSTSTNRTSAVAGSTSTDRTSAVAGFTGTDRTSAVAGSTSTNRTSAVAGSTSTNRTSAVAGSTSTKRTSAVAGSTSSNRTSAVAGSTNTDRTSAVAGSTSTNRTSAVAGSTSTNRTIADAGSTSTNRTSAVAGSTSTNRTSAVVGSTSTNTTNAVAGSTSSNRTSAVAGSTSANRLSAVAGTTSVNRTGKVAGITSDYSTSVVTATTCTYSTSAVVETTNARSAVAAITIANSTSVVSSTACNYSTSVVAGTTSAYDTSMTDSSTSANSAVAATNIANSTSVVASTASANSTSVVASTTSVAITSVTASTFSANTTSVVASTTSDYITSVVASTTSAYSTSLSVETTSASSAVSATTSVNSTSAVAGTAGTKRKAGHFTDAAMTLPKFKMEGGEEQPDDEEIGVAETFVHYLPSKLKLGRKHPDPVMESASLSSVEPVDVTYDVSLPNKIIRKGLLSALQLEAVVYASQAHEHLLPDNTRAGFLIGDGTGMGKGRTIAGIIFENYLRGRKRAIWVSVSRDLKSDAERDLRDIRAREIKVHGLDKIKYGEISSAEVGVIFSTYSALIGKSQSMVDTKYQTRLKQLQRWCGDDFDGVIVFDECHKAKNLYTGKPKIALAVLDLQTKLPKARVVYVSATGASEPKNMAYMVRLGIWGDGTPFKTFDDFIEAVEKRGVSAMEIIAMDMKLRGMYIARQLSFNGASFSIEEVPLSNAFKEAYDKSVKLWVTAMQFFAEAAKLINMESGKKKTLWGQFWSSHQRFFKYLCVAAKVKHAVSKARDAKKCGKCVVIGLHSTGEASTLDQLERDDGELSEFVSTAKSVFKTLVEKHFPCHKSDNYGKADTSGRKSAAANPKVESSSDKDDEEKHEPRRRIESDSDDESEADTSEESSTDDVDEKEKHEERRSPRSYSRSDSDNESEADTSRRKSANRKIEISSDEDELKEKHEEGWSPTFNKQSDNDGGCADNRPPSPSRIQRARRMKEELLQAIEILGESLPLNTLDQLVDDLGGTDKVAEITGRRRRLVRKGGKIQSERRSKAVGLLEKQRFMDGQKLVVIISEAASCGISLQSDRRVRNQRQRVHITLELSYSAEIAVQQFGRTHRSNQVNAPEYIFLISDLAGERRFASIVAKRLDLLGALTQADRRAKDTWDLSQFNIDNKYGCAAIKTVMGAIINKESPPVAQPSDYTGDFFRDVAEALEGVGLIINSEGEPQLDKDYNNMSKFLNRILGMPVELQNRLFKYFTDTLDANIERAKQEGTFDLGIQDLGSCGERVRRIKCVRYWRQHATGRAPVELHTVSSERGMDWPEALEKCSELSGTEEGFYVSKQSCNEFDTFTALLCVSLRARVAVSSSRKHNMFQTYSPNTGLQLPPKCLEEIEEKYRKVESAEAESWWRAQYNASLDICSHTYLDGLCRDAPDCEKGMRVRTHHVLAGLVLAVWTRVEHYCKTQVVRIKADDGRKIIGTLIRNNCLEQLKKKLSSDAVAVSEEKFE